MMKAAPTPFREEYDLQRLTAFLQKARAHFGLCGYWHPGDLNWRVFLQGIYGNPSINMQIWEISDGSVVGFTGYYPDSATFDIQVDPNLFSTSLLDDMLDWLESHHLTCQTEMLEPRNMLRSDVGFYENESHLVSRLIRRGYASAPTGEGLMVRSLQEDIPLPDLPTGFSIRPVLPAEAGERAAVHRAAFQSRRVTIEQYQRLMHMPGYQAELDLVVTAPDGLFAAYAMGWMDPLNQTGEFEPVGTHPAFRGLGLGKAILLAGMQQMKKVGAKEVIVGPIEAEVVSFYQHAGFKVHCKTVHFQKVFSIKRETA